MMILPTTLDNLRAFLELSTENELQGLSNEVKNYLSEREPAKRRFKVTKNARRSKKTVSGGDTSMRPLNSWIAFRSYYAPIFNGQQKEISPLLNKLWKTDPFHAKWTILAQAYSRIREQVGKNKAPLSKFLKLACPHIGILGPSSYLEALGWKFHQTKCNLVKIRQPAIMSFDEHIRNTKLSVEEVVRYCAARKYFDATSTSMRPPVTNTLAMASAPVTSISNFDRLNLNDNGYINIQSSGSPQEKTSTQTLKDATCAQLADAIINHPPTSGQWTGLGSQLKSSYMNAGHQIAYSQQMTNLSGEAHPFLDQWQKVSVYDPLIQPLLGNDFDPVDFNQVVTNDIVPQRYEVLHYRPEGDYFNDAFKPADCVMEDGISPVDATDLVSFDASWQMLMDAAGQDTLSSQSKPVAIQHSDRMSSNHWSMFPDDCISTQLANFDDRRQIK